MGGYPQCRFALPLPRLSPAADSRRPIGMDLQWLIWDAGGDVTSEQADIRWCVTRTDDGHLANLVTPAAVQAALQRSGNSPETIRLRLSSACSRKCDRATLLTLELLQQMRCSIVAGAGRRNRSLVTPRSRLSG